MSGSSDALRLERRSAFPEGLTRIGPREIRQVLPQPALITLPGRREPPVFVSTLLHGNETTSFYVLQDLARRAAEGRLARSVIVFVGAVDAAEHGVRFRDGQADFNRVWAGGDSVQARIAAEVAQTVRAARPMASIDIHNTTGANPSYACVAHLDGPHLALAGLFSRIAVHYANPPTTQSVAFSAFCPSVTVECGRSGDAAGQARAIQFVQDALHLEALPDHPPRPGDQVIYHTVGRVELAPGAVAAFGEAGEAMFDADFDRLNFTDLAAGAPFARIGGDRVPVIVVDEARNDITARFFSRDGDVLRLTRPATPAMLTTDALIVQQDCVGYLMEPVPAAGAAQAAGRAG